MTNFTIKSRLRSFKYAFNGLNYSIRTQHNIWIHLFATISAIALGIYYSISITEWCFIIGAIGFVIVTELINTAIELIVDKISPERNEIAGLIKDIAAGAVLISAITALAIGIIIYGSKIF